jgi:hypothetical protein
MATEKQISANRRNGMLSRGPKTVTGKAKSSRNAFRHGLAISASRDPAVANAIEPLAHTLTDPSNKGRFSQAKVAAEAQLDLARIRATRVKLVSQMPIFGQLSPDTSANNFVVSVSPEVDRLDRYERRALSRRKRALRALS